MKNLNLNNIDSVLIIRLSSLGDIILTTPLIRSMKNSFPKIIIDMIVKEQYKDAIINNPYVRNKLLFDSKNKTELLDDIKSKKYNLVIDLQNNLHSKKILSALGGIHVKFDKLSFKKFLLVNTKINLLRDSKQIPYRYAETLKGFQLDDEGLDLFTELKPSGYLGQGNNYIGICPGARHFTKMWPKEYFIKLCRLLIKSGWEVILFGGRSDRLICLEIKNEVPETINLQNDNDLLQTVADFKLCKAVYCNDSGLMHAAAAVKVPVIVFFGSTVNELGFTPYKVKNIILENSDLSCRPCSHIGRRRCPKKHFNCMKEISPQLAFDALEKLLKE